MLGIESVNHVEPTEFSKIDVSKFTTPLTRLEHRQIEEEFVTRQCGKNFRNKKLLTQKPLQCYRNK